MLLQGQLAAPEFLLGHSEQVLVGREQLGAQASFLPNAVAFFTEKLPSLGELVERFSKENKTNSFRHSEVQGRDK